jgi:hypothetical protein
VLAPEVVVPSLHPILFHVGLVADAPLCAMIALAWMFGTRVASLQPMRALGSHPVLIDSKGMIYTVDCPRPPENVRQDWLASQQELSVRSIKMDNSRTLPDAAGAVRSKGNTI